MLLTLMTCPKVRPADLTFETDIPVDSFPVQFGVGKRGLKKQNKKATILSQCEQ